MIFAIVIKEAGSELACSNHPRAGNLQGLTARLKMSDALTAFYVFVLSDSIHFYKYFTNTYLGPRVCKSLC